MHFVGNLILVTTCGFYYNDVDVTVTSFINIKFCGTAVKVVPQQTACYYSFFCVGKKLNANEIQSSI